MATTNANGANAQVNGVNNTNTAAAINAHEQYVMDNLSAYSGKRDELCKSTKSGFLAKRKEHNLFNGMWLDNVNGQDNKNYKEFLLMPSVKNDTRMECDHIQVAMQLDGKIVDTYYLLTEFRPKTDKYVTYDAKGLQSAISKKYTKGYQLIVLGYQYNGKFTPCTDIEKIAFVEKREVPMYTEEAQADGTIKRSYTYVVDSESGSRKIQTHVVEQTLVPVLTDKVKPAKFTDALNRAIAKNWLRIFGEDKPAESNNSVVESEDKPKKTTTRKSGKKGGRKGGKKGGKKESK